MIGRRFGKLVVVSETNERVSGQKMWLCRCDCGNFKKANKGNLEHGNVKSCGCIVGKQNIKHGDSVKRIRIIWKNMMKGCYSTTDPQYNDYGGRGIVVCSEWLNYCNFKTWAYSNGYSDSLTLDRFPNMNGNYEPNNCRWADYMQQANNRRSNVFIEYNGSVKTMAQWAREYGIGQTRVRRRLLLGWSLGEALNTPIDTTKINKRFKNVN